MIQTYGVHAIHDNATVDNKCSSSRQYEAVATNKTHNLKSCDDVVHVRRRSLLRQPVDSWAPVLLLPVLPVLLCDDWLRHVYCVTRKSYYRKKAILNVSMQLASYTFSYCCQYAVR